MRDKLDESSPLKKASKIGSTQVEYSMVSLSDGQLILRLIWFQR